MDNYELGNSYYRTVLSEVRLSDLYEELGITEEPEDIDEVIDQRFNQLWGQMTEEDKTSWLEEAKEWVEV